VLIEIILHSRIACNLKGRCLLSRSPFRAVFADEDLPLEIGFCKRHCAQKGHPLHCSPGNENGTVL